MNPQDQQNCLELTTAGQVTLVRFTREVILSGALAEAVAEQLTAFLAEPARCRLLLDFANVRSLSSLMLGKLISLNRAAEAAGGRLALCKLRPEIAEIMEVTRLNRILNIHAGEQDAMQRF